MRQLYIERRDLGSCSFRFFDDAPVEQLVILGRGISTPSKGLGGYAPKMDI